MPSLIELGQVLGWHLQVASLPLDAPLATSPHTNTNRPITYLTIQELLGRIGPCLGPR